MAHLTKHEEGQEHLKGSWKECFRWCPKSCGYYTIQQRNLNDHVKACKYPSPCSSPVTEPKPALPCTVINRQVESSQYERVPEREGTSSIEVPDSSNPIHDTYSTSEGDLGAHQVAYPNPAQVEGDNRYTDQDGDTYPINLYQPAAHHDSFFAAAGNSQMTSFEHILSVRVPVPEHTLAVGRDSTAPLTHQTEVVGQNTEHSYHDYSAWTNNGFDGARSLQHQPFFPRPWELGLGLLAGSYYPQVFGSRLGEGQIERVQFCAIREHFGVPVQGNQFRDRRYLHNQYVGCDTSFTHFNAPGTFDDTALSYNIANQAGNWEQMSFPTDPHPTQWNHKHYTS